MGEMARRGCYRDTCFIEGLAMNRAYSDTELMHLISQYEILIVSFF